MNTHLRPELIVRFIRMLKLITKLANTTKETVSFCQFPRGIFSPIEIAIKAWYIDIQPSNKFFTSEAIWIFPK